MSQVRQLKSRPRLQLEALEHRDNPAGTVTSTLVNGVLTITGDDAANQIEIVFPPVSSGGGVSISALDGETLNGEGFSGVIKSIIIDMGGGNDRITTSFNSDVNIGTGLIKIDMGDGDNVFDWSNMSSINCGALTYIGGDGDDTVNFGPRGNSTISGPITVNGSTGLLNFTLFQDTNFGTMNVTGGINATNNAGTTYVNLFSVNTTKVTVNGNDGVKSDDIAQLQLNGSKLTGPATVSTGYANAKVLVTAGQINGVTINSKLSADFSGFDFNYDTLTSKAVPTGNIHLTSGTYSQLSINQSSVLDSNIGNLTANAASGADIHFIGGTIGSGHAKKIGNVSTTSGTNNNANVVIDSATSVGTVTANTSVAGDDIDISLLDIGKTGVITARARDSADINLFRVGESSSIVATGRTAFLNINDANKLGAITATTSNSATILVTNATQEIGALRATSVNLASIELSNVPKTGTMTATSSAPLSTSSVKLLDTTTGNSVTKTGGNITVNGGLSNLWIDGGNSTIVNGNVSVAARTYTGQLTTIQAGNNLTVEGTTTITGGLGAKLTLNGTTGNSIFKNAVSVTATNPLGLVSLRSQGNSATFDKNLSVKTAGIGEVNFSSANLSEVKGDFIYTGGIFEDTISISPNFKAKNLNWNTKSGNSEINIGDIASTTLVSVSGSFNFTSGTGRDTINLQGISVNGLTNILTGANTDIVNINNSTLAGNSKIDTGAGMDRLHIADQIGAKQVTTINGIAIYSLGAGNDELTLGRTTGGDANSVATFTNTQFTRINGGLDLDLYRSNSATNLTIQVIGF